MGRRTFSPGTGYLIFIMIMVILVSFAGVAYAVLLGVVSDGGRGGAVGVAITFLILFVGRASAEASLEAEFPATDEIDNDAIELARVRNAVAAILDWSSKEKRYLTASSIIATLVWGFGDAIARWLGAHPG